MSILVQEPEYYLGNSTPVEVAKYNAETGKMHVLAGGHEHIDRIMQQAKESEGLKPDLIATLEQVIAAWEKAPEIREVVSLGSNVLL